MSLTMINVQFFYKLDPSERYPSKPYIKEGHPGNRTVVVNTTVQLSCPPVSDLEPYLYWIRPYNFSLKDAEVGPSDAPIPVGDVIEVFEQYHLVVVIVNMFKQLVEVVFILIYYTL